MTNLDGKITIITGGGSGIGQGIALSLANEGSKVVLCGRRQEKVAESIELIEEAGGEAIGIQTDVSQAQGVDRLVKTTLETYGRIDILVNNAGIGGGGPIHKHDVAAWNRIMDVNLCGAFLMARAVLPIMRTQQAGHIINISSESGLNHYLGDGAYGVSKHAMNALGEYIQRENQSKNIRVNSICPGMVVTEMTENSPGLDSEKCLYPEDIAELVIWLLSRRQNIKIGTPILIQTMENPWE